MMTDEQLAAAYNQLDLLVQPEGDEAPEALMVHIRELQQENTRLQSLVYRVANEMKLTDMYRLPSDLIEELEMFRDVDRERTEHD
jgi:hypothetical protein